LNEHVLYDFTGCCWCDLMVLVGNGKSIVAHSPTGWSNADKESASSAYCELGERVSVDKKPGSIRTGNRLLLMLPFVAEVRCEGDLSGPARAREAIMPTWSLCTNFDCC
jgi:hypothetical protein